MKRMKEIIKRRLQNGRGLLVATFIALLLLLLAACGGQQTTPVAPTLETVVAVPSPTLALPSTPTAGVTAAPTESPATATATASTPAETATAQATDEPVSLATYEDSVAYFALDYPAAWYVMDVPQEEKVGMPGYILTFLSWDPGAGGLQQIPAGETIVEVNVQPAGDESLEEAAASMTASLGTRVQIVSESAVTLGNGLPAMRWLLDTPAGPTHVVLTVIGERPIMLRGWGDEVIFDQIADSLRSTYTHADDALRIVFAPGATAATVEGSFSGQGQARYLFWAAEGQVVSLSVTSPQNSTLFHLEGVQDGAAYKHLLDGENSWQGALTVSQDYLLTVDNSDMPAQYTIELSIVDK
jgi:hypothetical protein